jgi:tRNA(Ile)-lysidine synthase
VPLPLHSEFLDLPKTQKFLLAISGGRDSVALLHTLLEAGYHNLVLCHLNHQLRGDESDLDADFVKELATKFNLPCETEAISVSKVCRTTGESMELAARKTRHTFLARCATQHQSHNILIAHHADDQAETILFNLLRGSGGLKGMQFSKEHLIDDTKVTFLRPLLEVTRTQINQFLETGGIRYREDTSNAQSIATRNRIRNEAMPLLSNIMGREVRSALIRAATISSAKESALEKILHEHRLKDPQGRLFLPKLNALPPALQQMALHHYLKQAEIHDISQDLLNRCLTLLPPSPVSKINLPGNRFLRRKEQRLFIDPATK